MCEKHNCKKFKFYFSRTRGTNKVLQFGRTTGSKNNVIEKSIISFPQNNSSFIILDDEDERWRQGTRDEAQWRWMHRSKYITGRKGDQGMTLVMMLRQVQKTVRVLPDNTLKDKTNKEDQECEFVKYRTTYKKEKGYDEKLELIKKSIKLLVMQLDGL